ncbi:MAG TPA: ACP phosphodiesterase [Saprospiraceae bacterium]|nr:ACP phosphodiesterase [Saprospiraceae bacterium]
MNYLAHALLSPDDPQIMMGNLWGDILKPRDYPLLSPGVNTGIQRHRMIDAFTDQHRDVDEINRLIRPFQGKYTPVVADVLMDFILSKYWHLFHPKPLEKFCNNKYQLVTKHIRLIPERLHPRIQRMISHRWLESCKDRNRMEQTFLMLSKRASFENKIPDAMKPYNIYEKEMDSLFLRFFEELRSYINLQNAR